MLELLVLVESLSDVDVLSDVESLALVDILCESDSLSEPFNDADVLVEPDWLVLLEHTC